MVNGINSSLDALVGGGGNVVEEGMKHDVVNCWSVKDASNSVRYWMN